MKNNLLKIFLIFLFTSILFAQLEKGKLKITGKTLQGKVLNGEDVREVRGDVHIYQDDIIITCDVAVRYLKKNDVELIGNVVLKKDTVVLFTDYAYYQANNKIVFSNAGILLNDGKNILSAKIGHYFIDEDRSEFEEDVLMFNNISHLTSDKLIYWNKDDQSLARGNVIVRDTASVIRCDSMHSFNGNKTIYANKKQLINDKC